MIKVGDKVGGVELEPIDIEQTDLKAGDIGVVELMATEDYEPDDYCHVRFSNVSYAKRCSNLNSDGTYVMYMRQLQLANKKLTESSKERVNNFDGGLQK